MARLRMNTGSSDGTSLQGYLEGPWSFEETIARLLGAGFTMQEGDGDKVSVEFVGTFDGHTFTLYDYKEDREVHIGGTRQLNVPGLHRELLALLTAATPCPYVAAEYYDGCEGHAWPVVVPQ